MKGLQYILAASAILLAMNAGAQQTDSVRLKPFMLIKPEVSLGHSAVNGGSFNWQTGGSVFLYANDFQRYGLTANYINIDYGNVEMVSAGIVIEMIMFKYFYGRAGTVGFFGVKNAPLVSFGLTSNIGFEYPFGFFILSAGYKAEAIITNKWLANNNFYVQGGFKIDQKVKPKQPKKF